MSTLSISILRLTYSKAQYLRAVYYSSQLNQARENQVGKVVNVAIIGAPNSGKSTLINNIVERKVCSTIFSHHNLKINQNLILFTTTFQICAASNKVHTTTKLIRAMCFQNDTQIIFLDTPGVVTEKEQKK